MTALVEELVGARGLLSDLDLGGGRARELLALAARSKGAGDAAGRPLEGRSIALVFERLSTRSRCALEAAAGELGARTTFLDASTLHLGSQESPGDTARALSEIFDGIVYAGAHATLVQMAGAASVPVWNAGTERWRPVQALADVLTMREYGGDEPSEIAFCFTGDARAPIAASLLVTGASLGMDVRIASPAHMRPSSDVLRGVRDLARRSGARVLVTEGARDAVAGAGFVHTAAWLRADETRSSWITRVPNLVPYRVTDQLMEATGRPDARFMHDLPAVHDAGSALGRRVHQQFGLNGAEVTEAVFRSPRSVVSRQVANCGPVFKAVLLSTFERDVSGT
ncbi:ornithine carbamoyltransferase subunit F [Spirillospora sp. NPDC052269]